MKKSTTIGNHLIQRLEKTGLKHVPGIPGDHVLRFYDFLPGSSMQLAGTPVPKLFFCFIGHSSRFYCIDF